MPIEQGDNYVPSIVRDSSALAVKQLELSQLNLNQDELLGEEVDTDNLRIVMSDNLGFDIGDSIIDGSVNRTIDFASTLTISIEDYDRYVLRSGRLSNKMDIQVEGLWWRLAQMEKRGDVMTLTFEEREVAVLRLYNSYIYPTNKTSRATVTRAEFILRLLKEVKEFSIPYYIPELHTAQPIQTKANQVTFTENKQQRDPGISPKETKIRVKKAVPDHEQRENMQTILRVGNSMIPDSNPHKRKMLVVAMMTATQENSFKNHECEQGPGYKYNCGVFQQNSQWWPATNDTATDATAFFEHLIKADKEDPNLNYNDLAQRVQGSGYPFAYGQWQSEAEIEVDTYGIPGGDSATSAAAANSSGSDNVNTPLAITSNYFFYRGKPPITGYPKWRPESSWECIKRLAQEVNWRAFFVSGTFYFMSEDQLFKSMPREILSEDTPGVNSIDGDSDRNKKVGSVDISCQMGLFDIPPGVVVKLFDMGPFNGRWLVSTIERNLFQPTGTINLKKPNPVVETLEPLQGNIKPNAFGAGTITTATPKTTNGKTPDLAPTSGKTVDCCREILKLMNIRVLDDNGAATGQLQKAANGQMLTSPCPSLGLVPLDPRVPCFINSLLNMGYYISISSICETHPCDSDSGNVSDHSKGKAVDINKIGKTGTGFLRVDTPNAATKQLIFEVMALAKQYGATQVICNGNGVSQTDIQAKQWDHDHYGFSPLIDDHLNHVHVGFGP